MKTNTCIFRLSAKLQEAQKSKEEMENDNKVKQEQLENLQPKLNNILQVNVLYVRLCLLSPCEKH